MPASQDILRYALGFLVAVLLVVLCAYLIRMTFVDDDRDVVTVFDPAHPESSRADPRHARWMAEWERVPLARIPWQRMGLPTEASVESAALPWGRRAGAPESATVGLAELPRIRPRRVLASPVHVNLNIADCPWNADARQNRPARVDLAELPHLHPRRNPALPQPVVLPVAESPWQRSVAHPQSVDLPTARVPASLANESSTARHPGAP